MELSQTDNNSFKITTKQASLALNPPAATKGADGEFYFTAHEGQGDTMSFSMPGEYEIKGVMVEGIGLSDGHIGYKFGTEDGISVGIVPPEVSDLTDDQVEAYDGLTVLAVNVPAGGVDKATKLIGQFEPKYVVAYGHDEATLKALKDEFGGEVQVMDKLKLSSKDLLLETQTLVALK